MWWAPRATPCSPSHCTVQSAVCRQDSTLKPLVIPLYVIFSPIICFEGFELLWTWCGHSFVVKCRNSRKSAHPPRWQTCMMLRSWVLFQETTVTTKECLCHVLQRFECPKQIIGQTAASSPDSTQHSEWYHVTRAGASCKECHISYIPISISQSDLVIIGKV